MSFSWQHITRKCHSGALADNSAPTKNVRQGLHMRTCVIITYAEYVLSESYEDCINICAKGVKAWEYIIIILWKVIKRYWQICTTKNSTHDLHTLCYVPVLQPDVLTCTCTLMTLSMVLLIMPIRRECELHANDEWFIMGIGQETNRCIVMDFCNIVVTYWLLMEFQETIMQIKIKRSAIDSQNKINCDLLNGYVLLLIYSLLTRKPLNLFIYRRRRIWNQINNF